jgi:hypothetical protein
MNNRRTARRYDLSLPVVVCAPVNKEAALRIGKTRDISSRGVYFTIDNDLIAGAELDLMMILPTEGIGGAQVSIRATGKIIRVDKRPGNGDHKVDVAVVFEMHEIVRNEAAFA